MNKIIKYICEESNISHNPLLVKSLTDLDVPINNATTKIWTVAEKQDAKNQLALEISLLKDQKLPLTQLLKAFLPPKIKFPAFIPTVDLDAVMINYNLQQGTFTLKGTLKSSFDLGWGIQKLKSNSIELEVA